MRAIIGFSMAAVFLAMSVVIDPFGWRPETPVPVSAERLKMQEGEFPPAWGMPVLMYGRLEVSNGEYVLMDLETGGETLIDVSSEWDECVGTLVGREVNLIADTAIRGGLTNILYVRDTAAPDLDFENPVGICGDLDRYRYYLRGNGI